MSTLKGWPKAPSESQALVNFTKGASSSQTKIGAPKRLTNAEHKDRKARGLCFRCDERWGVGHKCKNKELSVLILGDTEGTVDEGGGYGGEEEYGEQEGASVEISLCSVVGISNPRTMKVRGFLGERKVVVMVNPGATHNFISVSMAEETRIRVNRMRVFGVSLGNGQTIKGRGSCEPVRLVLEGGMEVVDSIRPL